MNYKQYHKSNLFVNPSDKVVKYRRYIEDNRNRLIQFIEGELTEILPQDFDNISQLPDKSLYYSPLSVALLFSDEDIIDKVTKIELANSITRIGTDENSCTLMTGGATIDKTLEIIFPKNLSIIYGILPEGEGVVYNFSKATRIPTWYQTNETLAEGTQVKVPKSLYNNWINTSPWSSIANSIVSV